MMQDERAKRLLALRERFVEVRVVDPVVREHDERNVLGRMVLELCNAMLEQLDGSDKDERRNADCVRLSLSRADAELIGEALDSHAYWQLSGTQYRRDGCVQPPGSDDAEKADEIRRVVWLANRVREAHKRS